MPVGVLNGIEIEEIVNDIFKSDSRIEPELEPADSAIDVPLGDYMYELSGSRRPGDSHSVMDVIRDHKIGDKTPLTTATRLDPGHVYLIKLAWDVELPSGLCVRATAKSSIGRLDALVRLVADHEREFDRVSAGKRAHLYVEVAPLTFPLDVKPGLKLSQLRLMRGDEEWCTVVHGAIIPPFEDPPVLHTPRGMDLRPSQGDNAGVLLRLNLEPDERTKLVGFRAKTNIKMAVDPSKKSHYAAADFWEPVSSDGLGDIRIHYAGFAHPYFGHGHPKGGAPLIFEVRGHSVDTILRHGDALAKVYFVECHARPRHPTCRAPIVTKSSRYQNASNPGMLVEYEDIAVHQAPVRCQDTRR